MHYHKISRKGKSVRTGNRLAVSLCGSVGKECRKRRFHSWVGKIPWRMARQPTQYSCPENPMDSGPGWLQSIGSQSQWLNQLCTLIRLEVEVGSDSKQAWWFVCLFVCLFVFEGGRRRRNGNVLKLGCGDDSFYTFVLKKSLTCTLKTSVVWYANNTPIRLLKISQCITLRKWKRKINIFQNGKQ